MLGVGYRVLGFWGSEVVKFRGLWLGAQMAWYRVWGSGTRDQGV